MRVRTVLFLSYFTVSLSVLTPSFFSALRAQAKPAAHSNTNCGPPHYCADTSLRVIQETKLPPPPVNQVFSDPDFGSRMVRVTDGTGIDRQLNGLSFTTNSSAEINEWGKFDPALGPHGGYYFYLMTSGGGAVFFSMDALTMQVTPRCSSQPNCRFRSDGTFSYVDPKLVYGYFEAPGNKIDMFDLGRAKQSTIYDFGKCPNIPRESAGYQGSLTNSGDDTKFSSYFGGRAQGFTTLVTYYDRTADRCYWYDTATGTMGGTVMPNTSVSVGMLSPPYVPSVKATEGDLPAGDYYAEITASTRMNPDAGETTPSPEAHIKLNSPGGIEVAPPTLDNPYRLQAVGYNVYIGNSPQREMRQATLQRLSNAYVQSGKLQNGPPPPATTTAGYNVHNARLSRDGKVIRINPQQSDGIYFWTPGTTKVTECWVGPNGLANFCGGHTVLGYSHMINHDGPAPYTSLLLRSLSDLSHTTELLPNNPGVPADMDTHWSWNNADVSDSAPVCGAFSESSFRIQGDGTQRPTNPLLAIRQAWDREIVCVATSGPPIVWRFAHHRATGACNSNARDGSCFGAIAIGNVSQDGKFYLFSTDWEWGLGGDNKFPGCPTSGKCRVDSFIVELK